MKLTFQIEYYTQWGEEVRVLFADGQSFPLQTQDGHVWRGDLAFNPLQIAAEIAYRYAIYRGDTCIRKEWAGVKRRLMVNLGYTHFILHDGWRDRPEDAYLYSSAFSGEGELHYPTGTEVNHGSSLLLKVRCPRLRHKSWQLAVSGNQDCLGNWNMKRPTLMTPCGPNEWCVLLDAKEISYPFEYKFLAWNTELGKEGEWMIGNNRRIASLPLRSGELMVISDDEVHFNLPQWKAAGVAIPVFSLRSEASWGVGDFGDLKHMVDWAAATGMKVVQILPINDTTITHTWTDSYPYKSISIYAFHPMFVDLNQLPHSVRREEFEAERARLNALPAVDYEAVNQLKRDYLRQIFSEDGENTLKSPEYQRFYAENKDWLLPYGLFCYFRDLYGTPNFRAWPRYSVYKKEEIGTMLEDADCRREVEFTCYVQYLLHVQLKAASDYARSKGVLLKGDIPIGISPDSVEAWTEPYYFNLNGQAGAPPDPFSEKGQNWGLPTYNWDEMAKDGYRWWKRRFRKMAEYFDAYRIDHILGFFRIWEIPLDSVEGLLGQFVPSLPLSPEEIEGFGLPFRQRQFTKPFITDEILAAQFGGLAETVKQRFLHQITEHSYDLLPEFDTQRKVADYFQRKHEPDAELLQAGLFNLINNVLFVPDRKAANRYHPRIGVQNDTVYAALTDAEKAAFNRLYNHYFYERHDAFWAEEAMKKLPELIDATRMLVCGEDLGMIPHCVNGVMDALKILSLEVQRMPKHPGELFGAPAHYPYRSVSTISTHDMSTLRGWWLEDYELTRRYFYQVLHGWGDCPREASGAICDAVVLQHLLGSSMLCILSLQDWLSIDEEVRCPDPTAERINVPANPHHYWRYRMPLSLERLLAEEKLNHRIREMIERTGRREE